MKNNSIKKMSLMGFAAIAITVSATFGTAHATEVQQKPIAEDVKSCINNFNNNMLTVLELAFLSIRQEKEFKEYAKEVGKKEAYDLALSDKTDFSDGQEALALINKFDSILLSKEVEDTFSNNEQDVALLKVCKTEDFRNKVKQTTELLNTSGDIKTSSVLKMK